MIRLRHVLHPVRSIGSVYRRASMYVYRRLAERHFHDIRCGKRDACWCGGELLPFKWHSSYGVCAKCGSYVNRYPPLRESLEQLYSIDLYWRKRQRLKGFPIIEDRAALYRSDGRLNQWLGLIEQYGPKTGRVIEVGCAPGVLLQELCKRGYECMGVEISDDVAEWMRQTSNLDVRAGFFPGVDLPPCHLFLSFDVLEHSPSPKDFIQEVHRILLPDGIAIIQTAIDRYDYSPPFGQRFADMFDDLEHLFLFTDNAIKNLALETGLEVISLDERIWLAGEVAVLKKP